MQRELSINTSAAWFPSESWPQGLQRMAFTVSTASYRTWIEEYLEEPHKRKLALGALDAFERLENAASISADDLVPIVEAASCHFVRVWEIGADLLNRLAVHHQAAQDAIRNMLG